jgi:DHA2 family multidrug resistance protein
MNNLPDKNKPDNNLRWYILLTVIIGTFLGRLDQTIVGLALPKIIQNFSISVSSAGWISTAYILANAIFVPVWGKLGDTIGQKKVYIFGFTIFIVGSVMAGFAWNLGSMLVFRVIQAIASSADYPTAMAILTLTFKAGKERAQALGIWSSSFAAAAVFGPLIGGPLIDNFGWRSIFFVNIPIGIIGLLMAMAFIHEFKKDKIKATFDWWGAMALGASLTSLVLVLDKRLDWGWISWQSCLCYLLILIFGYIFILIELKHKDPIVDMKFFKNNVFVNVLANNFIVFMMLIGGIFLIPIFAQMFLGLDATQTGYLFIPMAAMLLIAAPLGTSFVGKIKSNYVIMASTFISTIGIFFLSYLDPRSTSLAIIIPMMVMAFGMGLGMPQRTNIVASIVPSREIGSASSVLALVRNIAGAFGIAMYATILQNSTYGNIINLSANSHLSVKSPQFIAQFVALMSLKAQVSAYDQVFLVAVGFGILGTVTAYWIKVKREIKAEVIIEG